MKAASAVMRRSGSLQPDPDKGSVNKPVLEQAELWLEEASRQGADLIVLPGLLAEDDIPGDVWLGEMIRLSRSFPGLWICPGSYLEQEDAHTYHASCVLKDGTVVLRQRQIYLARWERQRGLSRGSALSTADIHVSSSSTRWRIGLLLTTDAHYPMVSRELAMRGTDVVLCPLALKGGGHPAAQLRGVWQNVQQNMFFAVESGFKGCSCGQRFFGRSFIHAPLAATPSEDGYLAAEKDEPGDEGNIIMAVLEQKQREAAMGPFNPLRQLNPDFYASVFDSSIFRPSGGSCR